MWLITFNQPGMILRQFEATHHASRVVACQPIGGITEPDHLDRLADPCGSFFSWDVEKPREPAHVFSASKSALDRQLLRYIAEQSANIHRAGANVDAEHLYFAGLQGQKRVKPADRGRLACAIRTKQANTFAGVDS